LPPTCCTFGQLHHRDIFSGHIIGEKLGGIQTSCHGEDKCEGSPARSLGWGLYHILYEGQLRQSALNWALILVVFGCPYEPVVGVVGQRGGDSGVVLATASFDG